MKRLFMFNILVLFISFFSACHKEVQQGDSSDYFPNSVGDQWVYDVSDSSTVGIVPNIPVKYSVTVKITGTKILADGIGANIWQYQYPWGYDTNYIRITSDTVKIFSLTYSRTIADLNYPRIIFLTPFEVNKRWAGLLLNIDSFKIINQTEIVVPQFQTFKGCYEICHHNVGYNSELKDTSWIMPNIGMIASHNNDYNNGPGLYRTWLLKSFSIH